jgi:AcrR family transcriptional regulator
MVVFWRRGYRGTSIDDLTEALEINRPSLYAAFGDKEELFLQVVDDYRDHMIVPAVSKLVNAKSLHDGLPAFFRALADIIVENETPPGCLIACLLAEECCESDVIKTKLATLIDSADRVFAKVFQDHRDELNAALTPEAAGKLLASTMHGLSVRARVGVGKRTLLEVCDAFAELVLV